MMMQQKFALLGSFEPRIERLNILQNRRVLVPAFLKYSVHSNMGKS